MYIQVYADEDMRRGVEIPIEEDRTVALEILQIEFEGATGLKSRAKDAADTNIFRLMPPSKNGRIFEPEGGWQSRVYVPTYKANKSKAPLESLLAVSVDPPGQYISNLDQSLNNSQLYEDNYNEENESNNADWADDNYQPSMGKATRVLAEQLKSSHPHNLLNDNYDDPYAMSPFPGPPRMRMASPIPLMSPLITRPHPPPMPFHKFIRPSSYEQSYIGNERYNNFGPYQPSRYPFKFDRFNPIGRGGYNHKMAKRYAKSTKEPVGTDNITGGPVFIYGLNTTTNENDIFNLFAPFGNVEKIDLMIDSNNGGCCKGFAFVTMSQKDDAINAIKTLDGHKYNQKILQVRFKADS